MHNSYKNTSQLFYIKESGAYQSLKAKTWDSGELAHQHSIIRIFAVYTMQSIELPDYTPTLHMDIKPFAC